MMTKTTETFLINNLVKEIDSHPHKDELVQLMHEQLSDFRNDRFMQDPGC